MSHFEIRRRYTGEVMHDGEVMYKGEATCFKEFVEGLVRSMADLRGANLCGATLCGAVLKGAKGYSE